MAWSRSNGTLSQVTATGDSGVITLGATDVVLVVSLKHVNGTGTISAGATVTPKYSHDGATYYSDQPFTFGTTASATEYQSYVPPGDGATVQKVKFSYTSPTGSTGHTLDVAYSTGTN